MAGTISTATGTFGQGNTITVTGSGFSTKRNGQILFDNFNRGTAGDVISTGGLGWVIYGNGGDSNVIEYAISTANPYIGSKNARAVLPVNFNPLGADDFGNGYFWSADQKEIYMEYSFYLDLTNNGLTVDNPQIKFARVVTDADATTAEDPWNGLNRFNAGDSSDTRATSSIQQAEPGPGSSSGSPYDYGPWYQDASSSFVDSMACLTWHQHTQYIKLSSTAGAADGLRFANVDGLDNMTNSNYAGGSFSDPLNTGVTNRAWDGAPLVTWGPLATAAFHFAYLPFFKRDSMSCTLDIGYAYINDSPERVIIHNAPTLAASTHWQVQKQTSRASGSIVIECQVGNLVGGDTKYVSQVNSDNSFSNSVILGASSTFNPAWAAGANQ